MSDASFIRPGIYRIRSGRPDVPVLYLELQSNNTVTAAPLNAESDTQRWRLTSEADGTFRIICVSRDLLLGAETSRPHRIAGFATSDSRHTWSMEPRGSNNYVVGSPAHGSAIHITEANRVRAWDRNNTVSQRWIFELISLQVSPSTSRLSSVYTTGRTLGGGGGTPFNHDPFIASITMAKLVEIRVRSASLVDAIQFVHSYQGQTFVSPRYGGSGGGEDIFRLGADEYIVRVAVRSGLLIDQIQFFTNLGRASPVYGGRGGSPMTWTSDPNVPRSGLGWMSGRSAGLLDALTPHFVPQSL